MSALAPFLVRFAKGPPERGNAPNSGKPDDGRHSFVTSVERETTDDR